VASFFQFWQKQADERAACKLQLKNRLPARAASDLSKKTGLRPGNNKA
jgi:hypothetical protein